MVRFLCFNAPIPCHRPKKVIEPPVEAVRKSMQDPSPSQPTKAPPIGTSFTTSRLKEKEIAQITDDAQEGTSSGSLDQGWKSEDVQTKVNIQTSRLLMRKSQSLGSGLCNEGNVASDMDTEDGIDQGFSSDSRDQNGLISPCGSRDSRTRLASHHKKDVLSDSAPVSSDFLNKGSIFSIDDPECSENGPENSDILLSGEGANESCNHTPRSIHTLVKSCSLPNLGTSDGYSHRHMTAHSRSYDDLQVLRMTQKDILMHEPEIQTKHEQEGDDNMRKTGTNNIETSHDGGYDSYSYCASAKDWIMPQSDGINSTKYQQGEYSNELWEELPIKDFKVKRIEDWVNDLEFCSPLEEPKGLLDTDDKLEKYSNVVSGSSAAKVGDMVTPNMEAAKRYISTLSASATMAQLSNHGLVVIPLLSAFVSLRVLNLSGNSIVRITAGALPRGLHMLNLSKNNVSTIEGLRELSRLRVLDLSYNRIFRIGHGLASCAALKELYLAGNKISEVEGLHRLLKLAVLDLRFNKISTAKCLGQLASNYNSLQAISLEGNPAQKNVGDEQLKKYLQGLLPNLVYFNRQPMKASTLKDAADRAVRLGMSAHHDRGLRSDNKISRKASHGLASSRLSSSTHGRKSQGVTSPKRSRGRRGHLPPTGGSKAMTNHHNHHLDLNNKILSLKSELLMHRSRSAGTLSAALDILSFSEIPINNCFWPMTYVLVVWFAV